MKAEDERSANKAAAAIQKRIAWVSSKLKSEKIPSVDSDVITGSDVVTSIKRVEISSSADTTALNTSDPIDKLAAIKQSSMLMNIS